MDVRHSLHEREVVNAHTGGSEDVQLLIWGCKAIMNDQGRLVGRTTALRMIGQRALAAAVRVTPVARSLSKCTAAAGRQSKRLS